MVTMKKLILLPVLMLAATSLNGMGRFAQQALPALCQMSRGAKPILLPATMPGIRSTGMRLLSTSSRAQQDGYDYAGYTGEQHARFGNREALFLGGAAALAGATAYYFSTPEGQLLQQAHAAAESNEHEPSPLFNAIDRASTEQARIDIINEAAKNGKLRAIILDPRERLQLIEIWNKHHELHYYVAKSIWTIFENAPGSYDMPLLKAIISQDGTAPTDFQECIAYAFSSKLNCFDLHSDLPKNDNQFIETWKLLIDSGSQEFRQSSIERVKENFYISTVHRYTNPTNTWWDRFKHKYKFVHKVDLYLNFLQYVVEKYPESASTMIEWGHVNRNRLSAFTVQHQQRYKEIETMYYKKMGGK
jgi:hypothetical protein